jgi:hypothetical protein
VLPAGEFELLQSEGEPIRVHERGPQRARQDTTF